MILVCFIYEIIFYNKINCKYYYNNYIYYYKEIKQLSMSKTYNMIIKLDIMYANLAKYSNFFLFYEHKKVFAENSPKSFKIAFNQICIYKEALNNFVI